MPSSIAKQNVGSQVDEFIWLAGVPSLYFDEENRCPSPDDKSVIDRSVKTERAISG